MTVTSVEIRPARPDDLPAIAAMFNHYIERSTCTFHLDPMSDAQYAAWLEDRSGRHPVTVAEVDGHVVGWALLSPWCRREAYARSVEGSVYVHHQRQCAGVGTALLRDLIERARALGHHTLIGGTCSEQAASLALQRKFGFR